MSVSLVKHRICSWKTYIVPLHLADPPDPLATNYELLQTSLQVPGGAEDTRQPLNGEKYIKG